MQRHKPVVGQPFWAAALTTTPENGYTSSMRFLTALLALAMALTLAAQEKKGPNPFAGPYKNLKLLKSEQLQPAMMAARVGFGQACAYCHVQGEWASDDNPKKAASLMMFDLVGQVNAKFADGKTHVTCYTCHRGEIEPKSAPPPAAPAQ